jgi:hypothetical protein
MARAMVESMLRANVPKVMILLSVMLSVPESESAYKQTGQ